MFFYSRKSSVSHQNAVEVEEAGQAVRFAKKKARAEAKAKAKADAKARAEARATANNRKETQR